MDCPRLDHFGRINTNGKIGKCGHMTKGKDFNSFDEMQNSKWLQDIKEKMKNNEWPEECVRCRMTEETTNTSIRLDMIERDRILRAIRKDYLIIGGVLDNICNSACQTCYSGLSTKIGSLSSKTYEKFNNYEIFFTFPQDRICEVDVSGGEPTASPNYKKLLKNLPASVKIIRINTNGSKIIKELEDLLSAGLRVIITISFDGVGKIHDYVRWPIKWNTFDKNVNTYKMLCKKYPNLRLNFWSTISCLNVGNLKNIIDYAKEKEITHSYGFCIEPEVLDVRYRNSFTLEAKKKLAGLEDKLINSIYKKCCSFEKDNEDELKQFISKQDLLRKINYNTFFNEA